MFAKFVYEYEHSVIVVHNVTFITIVWFVVDIESVIAVFVDRISDSICIFAYRCFDGFFIRLVRRPAPEIINSFLLACESH